MTTSTQSTSPLRQRMIDDMTMRRLNHSTQECYIRAVKRLAQFLGRSPNTATAEDLRLFQLHMADNKVSNTTINATITGLRFFCRVTLDDPALLRKMSTVYEPRKLPVILNPDEVKRLLEATVSLKYKAALATAYGAGLRASEVAHLKVSDIDSQQMLIHVEQGKGGKDRNAKLSPSLLKLLRYWWQAAQAEHKMLKGGWLFPGQNPVNPMSAIECCRSAALGGHVLCCQRCAQVQIAYNSCRNRHCPKCQGTAARRWLEARQADLLPVEYYHLVFTLPAPLGQLAYHNKAVIYHLLFKAAAETLRTIARDPKHLGAEIAATLVLHTWGSALTHHPHVHGIVPGGGFSADGQHWVACKPGFFLPVRVLSRLFRRWFTEALSKAHQRSDLQFHTDQLALADPQAFANWLKPLRQMEWVVYAKRPFAGPEAVLAYLSRYTHRVAIANSRFLLHILPRGFHRIRHYGFLGNAQRRDKLDKARTLLEVEAPDASGDASDGLQTEANCTFICRTCAAPMIIIETFERGYAPRAPPVSNTA